ncbi:glutamate ABC transporter substrate-binding protein [Gordonia sp. TBRC 11910]|uniref:Glutamate ABC transporter substrate-binding protein n=1 Tax=Gordonia asplenii TaxID=2725283 RepID=A0A848L379_9ACTN|nr:glutamate ABC transporter substrate-binding protein [Gordonia asplenii]
MSRRAALSRRRISAASIGAVLALTLSACVQFAAPDSPPPTATATPPTPAGVATDVTREPPPNESCDASVTLRPSDLPEPGRMAPNTTMAAIFGRGRLIVGLDIGSNPFSFRDPLSGDIMGFDVDIAREIARAIFNTPDRIEYRVLSSSDRIEALRSNTVDVVVKTMSITCERMQDVSFSAPYYIASQRILALRNSSIAGAADLAGQRVCAARGVTSIGRLQSIVPTVKMVETTTWADCLVLLQQGEVAAVSTDDAILAGLAVQDPWLKVVGPGLGTEYYGVGIPKGQDDMVRFVNAVLAAITASGRWQQIYNEWLSVLGPSYIAPRPVYRD